MMGTLGEKPRVALDLDGVVFDWDRAARRLLKERFGHDLPVSTSWDMIQQSIPKKDWQWLWTGGVKYGLFIGMPLFPGAAEGVGKLAEVADIVVCTQRPRNAWSDTLYDLGNLQVPIAEVHCLGPHTNKAFHLKDIELAVDDKLSNIDDYLHTPSTQLRAMNIVFWTQPHNESIATPAGVARYNDWDRFVAQARGLRA